MRNGTRVSFLLAALVLLATACAEDPERRLVGTWVAHPHPNTGMTFGSQGEWSDPRDEESQGRYEFLDTGELLVLPPEKAKPVLYTVRFSETKLVLTDSSGKIGVFERYDGD
jgi:hypothetical protein